MEDEVSSMVFKRLNPGACRTYLVGSSATREAALVDPVLERVEDYLQLLSKEGWQLRYVLDTHTHADHVSGAASLVDRAGAEYAMHRKSQVRRLGLRLSDGSTLPLGDLEIQVIETPGHTKDSVSLQLPGRLLTGDWLFIGGAGRTDLPGGDPGEHWDSLQRVMPGLDDGIRIFPAHDYQERSESTLGEERRANISLLRRERGDYVAWLSSLSRPAPEWMLKTIEANKVGTTDPGVSFMPPDGAACMACEPQVAAVTASLPSVSPEDVWATTKEKGAPLLLDVRQPEEYVGPLGHVPGAVLIPLGELSSRLSEIRDYRAREVVTICKSGARSGTAAQLLLKAGFKSVFTLSGGTEAWNRKGYPVER
ncbi:MAG: rhodanese-like domain-containing protein [Acidobacteriota bacterium]